MVLCLWDPIEKQTGMRKRMRKKRRREEVNGKGWSLNERASGIRGH